MYLKPVITGARLDKQIVRPGEQVTVSFDISLEEVPSMLIGMTANPDYLTGEKATSDTFTAFNVGTSRVRYMRDFGKDNLFKDPATGAYDTDILTEPTLQGTGKYAVAPEDCTFHQSFKDDPRLVVPYLDSATQPCFLTWWHEPMGDMTLDVYQRDVNTFRDLVMSHPNYHLVLGHGPIVTRYWLMQKAGTDPRTYGYDGMTMYGVDCYNDYIGTPTRYLAPAEMFAGLDRVEEAYPDVDLIVPEWGKGRIGTDTTGSGRAASMEDDIAFLNARSKRPVAIGWWNIGGDKITGLEPEQTTMRDILAAQQ